MSKAQESARWRREKTPVLSEYLEKSKQAFSAVAGRGFDKAPGFLYELQTGIEQAAKMKLSDINYAVLQEQVSQEIKEHEADYDLAYKNARIAWEVEKQSLFYNWQLELSLLQQEMAHDEELVNMLAVEVGKRAIDLQEAKTEIELEAEGYRQQLADLDGRTGDYEVQLANAKLLTAEKRLEIIPYIEQLIALEESIIVKEQDLVTKNEALVVKNEELLEKDEDLIERKTQLIAKNLELIHEQENLIDKEQEVIDKETDKVSAETTAIEAEQAFLNTKQSLLVPAINSMTDIIESLVAEIAVQSALYNQIADVNAETAGIESEITEKLGEVLAQRRILAETYAQLIEGINDLTEYKVENLVPALADLATTYEDYVEAIQEQVELKEAQLEQRRQIAEYSVDEVGLQRDVSEIENQAEALREDLNTAQNEIRQVQLALEVALAQHSRDTSQQTMDAENSRTATVDAADRATTDYIKALAISNKARRLETGLESRERLADSDVNQIEEVAREQAYAIERKAELNAAPEITANLSHLLRSA